MYKMIYVFLSCVLTFSFAETNKTADNIVKEKLNKNNSYSQKSFDSLIDEKIKWANRL